MESEQRYGKLRKMILVCMILVPLIPFFLTVIIGYYYFTSALEKRTISSTSRIVDDHRHMIEFFLQERRADLEFILYSYPFGYLAHPENLQQVFERLQIKSSAFVDLGVFNQEGVHVAYQGPFKLSGRIYRDADWFSAVMTKGYYVSDIFLGFRRVPHFVIAMARKQGPTTWVIRATIDTYMFNDLVKRVRIGRTGEAYLLNKQGVFQTERRSGGNILDEDRDFAKYLTETEGSEIATFIEKDYLGVDYFFATTWLKDKEWLLVVRQETKDAFGSLRQAGALILLIGLIGSGSIVAMAFFLTGRILDRMIKTDMEKDQLEEQLIRAGRLAELGEMAAGFAHEINNPLQIIRSEHALINMILLELTDKEKISAPEEMAELHDSINQIGLQVQRCSEITHSILKFGRKTETAAKDVDLKQFIPEVVRMISSKAGVNGVNIQFDISDDTPSVYGDSGQLQQVLINLLNNALDAIYEKCGVRGGELFITSGPINKDQVQISVKDNGCGIDIMNQKKIFSPFYTTKPIGKGTGLGLSVCYGIIHTMGGSMEVLSEKGIGTTFTVRLPASAGK
jgi:two-component system, NtrC family, sensor kinase